MQQKRKCPFCAEEIQLAAIICKHCGRNLTADASTAKRSWIWPVGTAAILVLAFAAWIVLGSESGRREIAAAVQAPVTVTDQIENVQAASWKAVPMAVPYSGNLDISLEVVNGNPLDVFLTTPDYRDALEQGNWKQVRVYSDFNATKSKAFRRTSQVGQGHYYLVLRDTSLGILSSRASDVAIKARLTP
jgi:hypothetical protein